MPDKTVLQVTAIQNDWAYTSYNGNSGWVNTTYLQKTEESPTMMKTEVRVYDTDGEGLSLKSAADVSSIRYTTIPENTVLILDEISSGWGHTSYNGYSGWVSLRYTQVISGIEAERPEMSLLTPARYTVYNTEGEGLELRTRPDVESSTFGPVRDGVILQVMAIKGDWAYTQYNGHYGWVNLTYLKKTE